MALFDELTPEGISCYNAFRELENDQEETMMQFAIAVGAFLAIVVVRKLMRRKSELSFYDAVMQEKEQFEKAVQVGLRKQCESEYPTNQSIEECLAPGEN